MKRWAILWREKTRREGKRSYIIWDATISGESDCRPYLFETRGKAREFIQERYGYIAKRRDLRAEPFGWKMTKAVRVVVEVKIA